MESTDRELDDQGTFVVKYSLPYSDLARWKEEGIELNRVKEKCSSLAAC